MKRKRGEEGREERSEENDDGPRVSRKKAKTEADPLKRFLSFAEDGDSAAGLTYFLNTTRREDGSSLIGAYLQECPLCEDILAPLLWERDRQTPDMMLLCFECLESILLHAASQSGSGSGMGPSPGHKLVGVILRDHMRPLYSALMTSCPMRLVAACLRLLTAMVMQGHTAARDVQQSFNFAYKPLIVFPNRTNRVKGSSDSVRTYFIKFALSFLVAGDNDVIRNILQLKKFLSSVFKLLPEDPVEVIHLFLSTLREKVLRNSGVSKRAKSALFNHYALKQLSSLLSLTGPAGEATEGRGREGEEFQLVSRESGEVVCVSLQEYVLEVLTELCTSFQCGVCYRTKLESLLAGRTNNSAILQLLLSLTGSLSLTGVQSLVSQAISTCPDLLSPYLQAVGLSFEPRSNSKWIDNIDFLTRLLSGLPPVPESLGMIGGCGQEVLVSLVPAAVGLTVPRATTRAFLNQGVQNPTPLVRLKTLDLMEAVLGRAVETASALDARQSTTSATSASMSYTDSVLKLLPELKTLVNLRQSLHQQLVSGATGQPSLEQAKASGGSLSLQHSLDNAALMEDCTLLTRCLEVMRGYQLLSPSLFLQADFNPARLLPSLPLLAAGRNTFPPSVLTATLRLLGETPSDYFKWQQQKSGVLASLLWLVVCGDREVYHDALRLTLRLLQSVEGLSQQEVEMGLGLTAARRFSSLCLPEESCGEGDREERDRQHFVEMLAEMFLALARDLQQFLKFQLPSETSGPNTDSTESLLNILAGPLEVPGAADVVTSVSGEEFEPLSPQFCPLLLSVIQHMDCDKYFPFFCDMVVKLLLGQFGTQISRHTASTLLSLADKWRSRLWRGLCQSLTGVLNCWAGITEMEVDEEVIEISSRKCVKKLMKCDTKCAVELLTSVSREVLLDCVVAVANKPHLHQALLYCCELRPLQLPVYRDNPAVQELLPSLPLPSLILQCVQLEHTTPSLLPISQLPVQQWQVSLGASVKGGDCFGVLCAARTVYALLQKLCATRNVCDPQVEVTGVCFHVLELLVNSLANPEKCVEDTSSEDTACPGTSSEEKLEAVRVRPIYSSPFSLSSFGRLLTAAVFASPLCLSLLGDQRWREGRGRGRGVEVECVRGLGRLLAAALGTCEEFRKSSCFRRLFQGLLGRVVGETWEEEEYIGVALVDVLRLTRPHLDSSLLSRAIEHLLSSLTLSPSPPPHIPRTLFTLLTPPHSSPETAPTDSNTITDEFQNPSSSGGVPVHFPSNEPEMSDPTLKQLLEATLRPGCALLAGPALAQICSRLPSASPGDLSLTRWASLAHICSRLPSASPGDLSLTRWVSLDQLQRSCREDRGSTDSERRGGEKESSGVEREFVRRLELVAGQASLKGLCSPFLLGVPNHLSRGQSSDSWLPQDLLYRLLEGSVGDGASLAQCSLAGCLLLHLPHRTLEHFSSSSSPCLLELCGRVVDGVGPQPGESEGSGPSSLESGLFLLCLYLSSLLRLRGTGRGNSERWRDAVKVVCKSVWKKCASLIQKTTDHHSSIIPGLSACVMCSLCQVSPKARKRVRKLVQSWDVSDTPWTRHQVCVVGVAGCAGEGDGGLCAVAASRLLSSLASLSPDEQREGEWTEGSVSLLCRLWVLLKSLGFGKEEEEEPVNIPSWEWNVFFDNTIRGGGVRLSTVVSCLCAGVKLLYPERGEEAREGLVALDSIHSTLWDHSEFRDILFSTSDSHQTLAAKESGVELLLVVSERSPGVCISSHVPSLLGAYTASCSRTDRGLLHLLFLYELNGVNLGKFRPYLWGEAGREAEGERRKLGWLHWEPPGLRQVLESLDSARMSLSLNHFPQLASLEPVNPFSGEAGRSEREEEEVYDPAFLLPLISHLLDPGGVVECREVVRTGVLSYLLVSLSSHLPDVRKAAAHCLSRFYTHLRSSTYREKPQLSLLLRIVKNTLEEEPQRLPSLHTIFCARVAHVFLHPELQLYLLAGHYLVHKPTLELRDIPLFNTLFLHSTTTTLDGGECEWLLGILVGGLRCLEDYRLYQRKKVLPHLMALFTGPSLNHKARSLVVELVLRACVYPAAASDLVWNHGLLPWLTHGTSRSNHAVVQKILSKVCQLVEGREKVDSGSDGAWKPPPLLEEELSLTASRYLSVC